MDITNKTGRRKTEIEEGFAPRVVQIQPKPLDLQVKVKDQEGWLLG